MKRLKYTVDELNCLYERLVTKAITQYNKHNYTKSINCIRSAAYFQYHINYIYNDIRLENLLRNISALFYQDVYGYIKSDVIFFYDSFCLDNRGLTQHYLDALFYNRFQVVYILEKPNYDVDSDIIRFLHEKKAIIQTLPHGSWKDKTDFLHLLIEQYKPSATLFHLHPYTTIPFIAFYPYKTMLKYQINLTDHAFWLGDSNFFNFSYEFRQYGVEVSRSRRGFKVEQLILNPFYPWQSSTPFQGFPISTEGKFIVFSGGAMYKIEGDNNMYFHISKAILDTYPNVILFYAGTGNSEHLERFIAENNYQQRFILLGQRKDIDAVFKKCDIYLSTYPIGGGLMSQYAAINKKPIIVYKSSKIEKEICTKQYAPFKFDTIEGIIEEIGKMINNQDYLYSKGVFINSLVSTQNDFREHFNNTFLKPFFTNDTLDCHEFIDYSEFHYEYIERINNNVFGLIEVPLIKNKVFTYKVIVNTLKYLSFKIINSIKDLLF